jgi:hypothetical protein
MDPGGASELLSTTERHEVTFTAYGYTTVKWAQRKYKRLRRHATNAAHWLGRVARRDPNLLVLWQLGIRPATGS